MIQKVILIIGVITAALTFFNQPSVILAITWLFAWLVPLFFIIIAGLFWKRNSTAAFTVVVWTWVINCAWSIRPLKNAIVDLIPPFAVLENAHIAAIVALILTVVMFGLVKHSEPAIFKSSLRVNTLEGESL